MGYLGVNVIKYLRKHLEEAMAAPDGQARPSWDGTEGRVGIEAWPKDATWNDGPPERVWDLRICCRRMPLLIGRGK